MAVKTFKKVLKNNEVTNRTLKKSVSFSVGKNEGVILCLEYIKTKSDKEPLKITIKNKESGAIGEYLIFEKTSYGRRLINMLINSIAYDDVEEISLNEFIGKKIGFETELNGKFENLIAFYSLENNNEDDELDDDDLQLDEDDDLQLYDDDDLQLDDDDDF